MKKELLLVGNKPLVFNYSEELDKDFDYIFRVNRMQSLGKSGNKISGLYLTIGHPFFEVFFTPEVHEKILKAEQIFVNNKQYPILVDSWEKCCTKEQFENTKILTFPIEGFKRIIPFYNSNNTPTSTLKLLDYLLYTPEWRDVYNINVTGITLLDRGSMMSNGFNWRNTSHKNVGECEAQYIINHVNSGDLTFIPLE